MNASMSTGDSAPTPDTLRLSRLDRLLDQLGEHQLTIRQQGVSVTDLAHRIRVAETKLDSNNEAVASLKDLDVPGQLAALNAAVDKLQRQANARSREHEDVRMQYDLLIQTIEQRLSASEAALLSLEERITAALDHQEIEVEELRQMTRTMLSQVVDRIADQFDSMQLSLEDIVAGRAEDKALANRTAADFHNSFAELRSWLHQQTSELKTDITQELNNEKDTAQSRADELSTTLRAVIERQAGQAEESARLHGIGLELGGRIADLEGARKAAEERESNASELMQEALAVWQRGLEDQVCEMAACLLDYKAYVRRLRKEVRSLEDERSGTHAALLEALSRELGGLSGGMGTLQRDAGGLLSELHQYKKQEAITSTLQTP